jgi:hypothetical protein
MYHLRMSGRAADLRKHGIVFGAVLAGLLSSTPELLAQSNAVTDEPAVAIVLEA